MAYRSSPLNPKARKPGKRGKTSGETVTAKDGRGRDVELDPALVKSYQAQCPTCGSLGLYLNPADAHTAEGTHQQTAHRNSPGKKTLSVEAQNKRNREGQKK